MKDADLVEVIVAPRRSVVVTAVIDHSQIAGQRTPIFGPKTCLPGEVVSVPAGEVAFLVERGFVLNPAGSDPEPSAHETDQSPPLQTPGEAA